MCCFQIVKISAFLKVDKDFDYRKKVIQTKPQIKPNI